MTRSRTFVCQVVPKHLTSKLIVSQAANNFCFHLIESKCFDDVFSLIPINITELIVVKKKYISFIQCRYFKRHAGIFKLFNSLIESIELAYKVKKYDSIWYYNITRQNFLSCFILNFFYGKTIYIILADFTPANNFFSIQNMIKIFIEKKVSGIISLSGRNTFSHSNMTSLAGIIPSNRIHNISLLQPIKNKFLLSGRLEESTGLTLAIETFAQLPDSTLFITGNLNDDMKYEISKHNNINYLGLLTYEEYLLLLEDIPFILNLRNPSFDKNTNNFPSKILEAFSYNRIVISTFIYPELDAFKYFYSKYEKDSLTRLIKDIEIMTDDKLKEYSNHASLLRNSFSEEVWKLYLSNTESLI